MVMEMSKTYQYRKVMKPLLERKRRARINKCLDDLKDLMVECLQQEGEHVTRLEKADILELTVEHMRKLKQRGTLSLQPPQASAHVESFRSGYVHAADQITQVLLQQRQTDELGGKIIKFLSTRLIEMQHQLVRNTNSTAIIGTSTPATVLPLQLPPANSPYHFSAVTTSNERIEATTLHGAERATYPFTNSAIDLNYKSFSGKDNNDLIDVTTVDNIETDTASVHSMDSNTSVETMWRPW